MSQNGEIREVVASSDTDGGIREIEMSRLRAEIRERLWKNWSRERMERWLDEHENNGYSEQEIRFGRMLVRHHEGYQAARYRDSLEREIGG